MSEQGWREFLAAEGLQDWVVLHGGAAAVFRVSSLIDGARLAGEVAEVAAGCGVVLTVTDQLVTVRITRDVWQLESRHIELARAVSAVARRFGAVADRSAVQEVQLAVAAKAEAIDVDFWRAVLGYSPMADDNAVDPLGHGSTVWMQELDEKKPLRHAMHVDVSVAREQARVRLEAALAGGLSMSLMRLHTGPSPIGPGTGFVSALGRMDQKFLRIDERWWFGAALVSAGDSTAKCST
jgi:4a-hydroxytetrahydrobiopterin dehydratase